MRGTQSRGLLFVRLVHAQHLGVGHREVGRRHRIGELADIEIDFLVRVGVWKFGLIYVLLQPLGGQQI